MSFMSSLSRTRSSTNLSDLDVVTNLIRETLDDKTGNKGFLQLATRYEATWNRFIKEHTDVMGRKEDTSYVKSQWKRFVANELEEIKELVFDFCVVQRVIREEFRESFWLKPQDHTHFPKEYEMVRNFAKALVNGFVESEYPKKIVDGPFYQWIEAMETSVRNHIEKEKFGDLERLKRLEEELKISQERAKRAEAVSKDAESRTQRVQQLAEEKLKDLSLTCEPPRELEAEFHNGNIVVSESSSGFTIVVEDYQEICAYVQQQTVAADTMHLLGKDEVLIAPVLYKAELDSVAQLTFRPVEPLNPMIHQYDQWMEKQPCFFSQKPYKPKPLKESGIFQNWRNPPPLGSKFPPAPRGNPKGFPFSEDEDEMPSPSSRGSNNPRPKRPGEFFG